MSEIKPQPARRAAPSGSRAGLSLAALGIVFGDIGTSPLYTFKTVLSDAGGRLDPGVILGSLSLVLWTLIIITTVKYVIVAMRIDNDGEGGILALMSLLGVKQRHRPAIIAVGLAGAALIYGDGAITPAISVLSALEGLEIAVPSFQPYVLPLAVVVLIGLFAVQPLGTASIGRTFGPVMFLWFLTIGGLGVWGVVRHPSVLWAINPAHALSFLFSSKGAALLVLGSVFLSVTGAEALYADMGHFGPGPIRLAWSGLVFPSLLLNYAGQAGSVLDGTSIAGNIFFRLCPAGFLVPMVVLATVATIIASQSIISGAFSMTRQAIQLGWMPPLRVTHTSAAGYGQIFVGPVNWLLMLATVGIAIGFKKSDNLAGAYGIAVSATMLMTSGLLFIAMREIWRWSLPAALALAGIFLTIDTAFVAANLMKLLDGGYVPLLLAGLVYGVMLLWHIGQRTVSTRLKEAQVPIDAFLRQIGEKPVARVPGTGVFLTRSLEGVPPVMQWQVKQMRALPRQMLILTVTTDPVPWVPKAGRLRWERLTADCWRACGRFGFMDRPDILALVNEMPRQSPAIDLSDLTYFVGHETVVPRDDGQGLPHWVVRTFAFLHRNSVHVSDQLCLPSELVVEIGREVAI